MAILAALECVKDGDMVIYDNDGMISFECAQSIYVAEVFISAEDEEKLRVLLNERKENKE